MPLSFRRLLVRVALALGVLPLAALPAAAQGGAITGKVTDAASGRPIENAQIQAQQTGGPSYGAISGADGSFRVVNLPDGSYTVTVRALGFEQRIFPNQRPGAVIDAAMVERPTQLNQTVVTASRSKPEKALDAPAQISVISSERLEERPAITVADHLRATPGVDISRGGIAQTNVVARGFNNAFSGSMLMLQDYRFAGVPSLRVNVPFLFTGTMEDIDRMEVLLGPASALYGPNSSNGVLHIITKSPFTSQGTTITLDGGERSVIRGGVRHSQKLNDKFAVKLSGEYMRGKDWEYNDLAEPKTFPTTDNVPASRRGAANNRDFNLERLTGEARLDVRPNERSEAITTLGYTNAMSGIELTGANGAAQVKNWTYLSLQQRFRYDRLFAQVFLNSSNAGNDNGMDDAGTYLLRSGQPIVDKSRVAAAQLQHGFDLNEKQSFTYGVDYIWTNPQTGGTINGSNEDGDNVTEYGGYIQSTTRPNKYLELLLAARGDANNVIAGSFFSPRAALIIKPTQNQNIRATYNRAFSTPANFSFFLDLIQSPNVGGSGYDVLARGNPPKEGFRFDRSCGSASDFGSFCMKSPFVGNGGFTAASAAAAFPGAVQALGPRVQPAVAAALQQAGLPAAAAAQVAGLAVQYLGSRQPTNAELPSRTAYITSTGTTLNPDELQDIAPLSASFNDTYELGWKGIVNNRFRYDMSFWRQRRGDIGASAAIATPSVLFVPERLGAYLGTQLAQGIGPALGQMGLNQQQIQAIVSGIAGAVTPQLAALPMGTVTFANGNTAANGIYATYLTSKGELWVSGMDLAVDLVATNRVTFDASYSWQNHNVFQHVDGGNALPYMSNSAKNRGSLGMRFNDEMRGFGFELRTRYNEAYPVNSGVFTTNFSFPIGAGQTGYTGTPPTGNGAYACDPAPTGSFCYEEVPEAFLVDAQISKRFQLGERKLVWSLNAQNVANKEVRTFAGVPNIGRMLMTRIQYTF